MVLFEWEPCICPCLCCFYTCITATHSLRCIVFIVALLLLCIEVAERSALNRMTADNLAIIFGPNLMWSKSRASLSSLGYVNSCTQLLITRYDDLFIK